MKTVRHGGNIGQGRLQERRKARGQRSELSKAAIVSDIDELHNGIRQVLVMLKVAVHGIDLLYVKVELVAA